MDSTTLIDLISIPLLVGLIGYLANWTGALMLVRPLRFRGVRVPGLRALMTRAPSALRRTPVLHRTGAVGWQGLVPAHAAAMAAVVAELADASRTPDGSASLAGDLDPDRLASFVIDAARPDIRALVEKIVRRDDPRLWQNLTPAMREAIHQHVASQDAQLSTRLATALRREGTDLVDLRAMLRRHFVAHPEQLTALLGRIGRREFRFLQNFGFYLGVPMGFVMFGILQVYPERWIVLVGAAVTGWLVSYLGLLFLLAPGAPRRTLGGRPGLLVRRYPEFAAELAELLHGIVGPADVGAELVHGPARDRSLLLLETALRPTVVQAITPARAATRVAIGTKEYDQARRWITSVPLLPAPAGPNGADGDGHASVQALSRRIAAAGPQGAAAFLRAGLARDAGLLHAHGALLGLLAYLLYRAVIGGG